MRIGLGVVGVAIVVLTGCGEGAAPPCPPGPYWIEEGDSLDVDLTCGDAAAGLTTLGVESLPPGATFDPVSKHLRWSPALDQAAVYELRLVGSGRTIKIGVADRFHDPGNLPLGDPSRYTEEFGLPVFHLDTPADLTKLEDVAVTVVFDGRTREASAKLRGESSLGFPKNSYTVKFPSNDLFDAPSVGGGFTDRKSLVLVTTFNDNSYLRSRLSFELWRRLSPEGVHLSSFSAVLFLNGRYHGIYTVLDHVNERLLLRHGFPEGGNLYKAESANANFKLEDSDGEPKISLSQGLEKKEGTPKEGEPGAFADAEDLTRFVATASGETFRTEAPARIDLRSYEDWWILANLLVARDSDVKNAYHAHPSPASRWHYIPWDLDGTFGQSWRTGRYQSSSPMDSGRSNGMFSRILAEPELAVPLRNRFRRLLRHELSPNVVHGLLDTLSRQVGPGSRRDQLRWGEAYRAYPEWSSRTDFTTPEEEREYIRKWIVERWAFLDARLSEQGATVR